MSNLECRGEQFPAKKKTSEEAILKEKKNLRFGGDREGIKVLAISFLGALRLADGSPFFSELNMALLNDFSVLFM